MRPYRVLIVGALAAIVCVRLGFWQVSRLHQRQAFRAMVEARMGQPPFELSAAAALAAVTFGTADSLTYRPAMARGVWDFSRQVVVVARVVEEVPSVYVVTPLRMRDGTAVLVERGWVPSPDAYTVRLDSLMEPDTAVVTGVLVPVSASREFAVRDSTWPVYAPSDAPAKLADRYPYPLLAWVLRRTHAEGALPSGLRPIAAPVIDSGPHLSYAIQWFAFATIAIVGSLALYRRSARQHDDGVSVSGVS